MMSLNRVDEDGNRFQFTSKFFPPYLRRTKSLEELIPWPYLKGISTEDFGEALSALLGSDAPLVCLREERIMGRHLTKEEVMAIHSLSDHTVPKRRIAQQLGIDESTVRYHLQRRATKAVDGRKNKPSKAAQLEKVLEAWNEAQASSKRPGNIRDLYEFLQAERGYEGLYKSILRYCRKKYGKPKMRTYRRVETPPGAQVQIDWGEFPRVKLCDRGETWLSVFLMTLSHSRKPAVVWSEDKKVMSGLSCHNRSYVQLGASHRCIASTMSRQRWQAGRGHGGRSILCTRISTESDVTKLVPHGWKEHYWPLLQNSRDEIVQRLLESW